MERNYVTVTLCTKFAKILFCFLFEYIIEKQIAEDWILPENVGDFVLQVPWWIALSLNAARGLYSFNPLNHPYPNHGFSPIIFTDLHKECEVLQ